MKILPKIEKWKFYQKRKSESFTKKVKVKVLPKNEKVKVLPEKEKWKFYQKRKSESFTKKRKSESFTRKGKREKLLNALNDSEVGTNYAVDPLHHWLEHVENAGIFWNDQTRRKGILFFVGARSDREEERMIVVMTSLWTLVSELPWWLGQECWGVGILIMFDILLLELSYSSFLPSFRPSVRRKVPQGERAHAHHINAWVTRLSARRAGRTKSSRPKGPPTRSWGLEGPKTSSI